MRLTGDSIGRLHIPVSVFDQLVQQRVSRRSSEFVGFCAKEAIKGSSDAVALLSLLAYNGFLDEGRDRLTIASQLAELAHWGKNAFGSFVLGAIKLELGEYGEARALFEQSAKAEFVPSTWFAAKMYELGIPDEPNHERAAQLYLAGKDLGYIFSDMSYADLVRSGEFGSIQSIYQSLLYPFYKLRFFVRNRFRSRVRATHLMPTFAAQALIDAINRS